LRILLCKRKVGGDISGERVPHGQNQASGAGLSDGAKGVSHLPAIEYRGMGREFARRLLAETASHALHCDHRGHRIHSVHEINPSIELSPTNRSG
jgi:hypothetical protein